MRQAMRFEGGGGYQLTEIAPFSRRKVPSLVASLTESARACLRRLTLANTQVVKGSVRMRRQGRGRVTHPLRINHLGSPRAPPAARPWRKVHGKEPLRHFPSRPEEGPPTPSAELAE